MTLLFTCESWRSQENYKTFFFQTTESDAVLTVTVNDLGNHGCYPDCLEMMSLPLYNEVTVNLFKRRPVSQMEALGTDFVLHPLAMFVCDVK